MKKLFLSITFLMSLIYLSSCGGGAEGLAKKNASYICELKDLIKDGEKNKSKIKALYNKVKSMGGQLIKQALRNPKKAKEMGEKFRKAYDKELKDGCGLSSTEASRISTQAMVLAK